MTDSATAVIVTAAGSTTAQSVIKGLRKQRRHRVRIIGTDTHIAGETAAAEYCDRFVTVPPASRPSQLIRSLRTLVRDEGVRLLVPIHDRELSVLASHRSEFPDGCCVLVSSPSAVGVCNDKWRTYQALVRWDFPTFPTMLPNSHRSLREQVFKAGFRYPLIAKPRDGVSSRDLHEIRSPDELVLVRRIRRPILQEKGEGPEFTVDTFSDRSGVLAVVPRLRIETRAGISYRGRTVHDAALDRLARGIVERLGVFGPANVQILRTPQGDRVVEINPRFSGGLPLTIASGVNSPSLALRLALGEEVPLVSGFREVTMARRWEETFYHGD